MGRVRRSRAHSKYSTTGQSKKFTSPETLEMRPLTVIVGILLGSCLAISVSLAGVLFVYFVLGDKYPRLQQEFQPLLAAILIFSAMTIISGASFYTLLTAHRARYWAFGLMLTGLAATIWYYLP
jgi:hypothetical protein